MSGFMLFGFLIAVGFVLALVILRAYSIGEDTARFLAKAERMRFQEEAPDEALSQLEEDEFIAYFEWMRRRRFWIYLLLFAGLAVPVTLLTMSVLSVIKVYADPGPWLWGFLALFALVAVWVLAAWLTLYLYRIRRDPSLFGHLSQWKKTSPRTPD